VASVWLNGMINRKRVPVSPSVTSILYSLMTPLTLLGSGGLQSKNMWVELIATPEEFRSCVPGAIRTIQITIVSIPHTYE